MPTSDLNILFIINPVSGGKRKTDWMPIIQEYFEPLPHKIDRCVLTGKNDENLIRQKIKDFSPHRVVAVGGDGTISLVAKQLLNSPIVLGILQGGSANGMATELNISTANETALDTIVNGTVSTIDVVKINDGDISLHLSDLGLNARIINLFDRSSKRGMWVYVRFFFKVLWQKKLVKVHIKADDIDRTESIYMIVIANATKYGTGAVINPDGQLDDGHFELVVVHTISLIELTKMFVSNRSFNPEKVEIFRTTKATITTKKRIHFQVDGEYKGKVKTVTAAVMPSALQIIT
ncbi:MAG: diacylglycerol kinase family protein [Ginsengibacter sp.]